MTRQVDQESAQETLTFSYAEFICRPCSGHVAISIENSLSLADDKSINCPLCNVAVKVESYDQQCLSNVHKSLGSSGKFLVPFAVVWFSVSLIVALFVNVQISMLMTSVGFLISYASNKSTPAIEQAIYLERDTKQVVSQGSVL